MKPAVWATEAVGHPRGHIAAARPTMAGSGWAMTLSQSCTARGSRPVHRMFCVSQSPWPIYARPRCRGQSFRTRRAASSTHPGAPTRLRSCPCSSRSGHSRRPGWSHPVHGGEDARSGTAAGAGAEAIRRARRAAKGAGPASVGRGLPPGTSVSAVDRHTVNPRRHGQRFRTWETHASQRSLDLQTAGESEAGRGRAFTTARRPLGNSTPTTSERNPERKSTRSNGAPR